MRVRSTSILCRPQITRKRAKFWNRVYVNLSFILTSHIIIQSHDTHVSHFIYYEKQKWQRHKIWKATYRMSEHTEAEHAGRGRGRGRCLLYKQLITAFVGRMLPGATSLYVAAAFKLFVVYGPKGPKVILNSYKAFMQREIGAHGTLGWGRGAASSQMRM